MIKNEKVNNILLLKEKMSEEISMPMISVGMLEKWGLPSDFQLYVQVDEEYYLKNRYSWRKAYILRDGKYIPYDFEMKKGDVIFVRKKLNFTFETPRSFLEILEMFQELDPESYAHNSKYNKFCRKLSKHQAELLETKYKPYVVNSIDLIPVNTPAFAFRNYYLYSAVESDIESLHYLKFLDKNLSYNLKCKKESSRSYINKLLGQQHRNKITKRFGRILSFEAKQKAQTKSENARFIRNQIIDI